MELVSLQRLLQCVGARLVGRVDSDATSDAGEGRRKKLRMSTFVGLVADVEFVVAFETSKV